MYMQKEEFGYPFHATFNILNIPYFIPSVIHTHDLNNILLLFFFIISQFSPKPQILPPKHFMCCINK